MTIQITLTADASGKGVHFNAGLTAHFAGFTPYELPLFLPEGGAETTQILHLDTPATGAEADTRVVLLEGQDFRYTFANHSVSGTIDTIRLGSLGPAWDEATGDLVTEGGLVAGMGDRITLSNLGIVNPVGVKGEVHAIVAGMMGGGPGGALADGQPILDRVRAEAHDLTGSAGNDRYAGTAFGDTVRGLGGRDVLNGRGGADRLSGGKGADILDGGKGGDVLTGGAGRDRFVFASAAEARGDRIADFERGGDRILLRGIDADDGAGGNQPFALVTAFSGNAGELRVRTTAKATFVAGDTDGDGAADFRIRLEGQHDLGADDFLL